MFKHVLVPVDLGHPEGNRKALEAARQIAKDYGAVLHFLTVVPPLDSFASTFFPEGFQEKAVQAAQDGLHRYTAQADLEGLPVHHIVAQGPIYDQVLQIANRVQPDLIVMASHMPGRSDYLLGPNAAKVVRHAGCSVMVIRG